MKNGTLSDEHFKTLAEMHRQYVALEMTAMLGLIVAVAFIIIISIEIWRFSTIGKFNTFIVVTTLLAFILIFIATLNSDTDVINSIITLTGTIMGLLLGLLIERGIYAGSTQKNSKPGSDTNDDPKAIETNREGDPGKE